mmetsp:Transcript_31741/g.94339  ORF Transcript_31741/g.94339 Transcript_31741/m.94339 type:complete len:252 (+) Transcript_31741:428-1183(+)
MQGQAGLGWAFRGRPACAIATTIGGYPARPGCAVDTSRPSRRRPEGAPLCASASGAEAVGVNLEPPPLSRVPPAPPCGWRVGGGLWCYDQVREIALEVERAKLRRRRSLLWRRLGRHLAKRHRLVHEPEDEAVLHVLVAGRGGRGGAGGCAGAVLRELLRQCYDPSALRTLQLPRGRRALGLWLAGCLPGLPRHLLAALARFASLQAWLTRSLSELSPLLLPLTRVESVLDGVVGTAWDSFRNLAPLVPQL